MPIFSIKKRSRRSMAAASPAGHRRWKRSFSSCVNDLQSGRSGTPESKSWVNFWRKFGELRSGIGRSFKRCGCACRYATHARYQGLYTAYCFPPPVLRLPGGTTQSSCCGSKLIPFSSILRTKRSSRRSSSGSSSPQLSQHIAECRILRAPVSVTRPNAVRNHTWVG